MVFAILLAILLASCSDASASTQAWEGSAFAQWTYNKHVKNVRISNAGIAADVVGVDSQFYAKLAVPLVPSPAHLVTVELRTQESGRCQLFWQTASMKTASEKCAKSFYVCGDGTWQTYRFRPGWFGEPIVRLRLDFPREFSGGTPVEVRRIAIEEAGVAKPVDADRFGYVTFRMKLPPGFHYCSMTWHSNNGPGWFGISPATDGEDHAYAFKLRGYATQVGRPSDGRGCKNVWSGMVPHVSFERRQTNEPLPVRDVQFLETMPDLPPDPAITSAHPYEAIPRAGRPFPVEIVVRNYGTRPASNLRFSFDGLPDGVRVLDAAALTPAEPLPGAEGSDTIQYKRMPMFKSQCVYRIRLSDLGIGKHAFGVTLSADGVAPRRAVVKAEVKPSLDLQKADYVPEPKRVDTAPYEIGAFIFPAWGRDFPYSWHTDWSHAPWRKPVLGWYDEAEPETMDWQIKHLAENGISYVSVDWYWSRGKIRREKQWPERFQKAKWRKYLKWQVNWCNESNPISGISRHTLKDHEAVTRFWIERYFSDPQYRRVNGMPSVMVFLARNLKAACAPGVTTRDYFALSQKLAREAGYKGIWFETTCGDNEDRETLDFIRSCGVHAVGQYGYWGRGVKGVPVAFDGSRSYKDIAATSYGHWMRVHQGLAGDVRIIPSLSTGWDNMPWQGETGWRMTDINAKDFRRICEDGKRFSDETGVRTLCLGALDEWGEGEIGYPNAEHGFGFFEAVRDTFGKKPKEGWPTNHAPEDVGRSCPNRLAWE